MSRKNRRYYHNKSSSKNKAQIEEKIQERELKKSFYEESEEHENSLFGEVEVEVTEEALDESEVITESEKRKADIDSREQKWYVLDTNLILSCVNVLPDIEDKHWREPLNFRPDLSDACLIIPETVKDELNHFKDSKTFNGIAARTALRRLANLLPNSGRSLEDIMCLRNPVSTGVGTQTIAVLPMHRNFTKCLPWAPESGDNDGRIAMTALAAKMIRHEIPVDGTAKADAVMQLCSGDDDVVLLTRDNDLLEKADRYAMSSARYSFSLRRPYNGCRELTVPVEMFEQFYHEEYLSRADFEYYMPDEPSLVANEYIIMEPENDEYPRSYFASSRPFANIARYHKENGMLYPLRFMKYEGVMPPNAGIAAYYDALNDDKIKVITVDGERGTGKTFQVVMHALREVIAGKRTKVIIIPSRSSKNQMGALPGKKEEKMEPLVATCKSAIAAHLITMPIFKNKREKLRKYGNADKNTGRDGLHDHGESENNYKKPKHRNILYDTEYIDDDSMVGGFEKSRKPSKKKEKSREYSEVPYGGLLSEKIPATLNYDEFLKKQVDYIFDHYFECCPKEEVDGKTFHDVFIIVDEIQRIHDTEELLTTLTRSAEDSKMVLCGDVAQIRGMTDEKLLNNGVTYAKAHYFNLEHTACIHLTENMRGGGSEYETEDYAEAYARITGR